MSKTFRELIEVDRESYDKVVGHPVQSWGWGEFRKKTGNKVARIGLFEGKDLKQAYQLTIHMIPCTSRQLGVMLKGPAPTQEIIDSLKELSLKENLMFVRIEPNVLAKDAKESFSVLEKNNVQPGKRMFTKETFYVDLTLSEDQLLERMHPKTRYNIRVAQRHGVEVVEDNSGKAFGEYLDLTAETTERQGFYAHTERYHKLMWETLKVRKGKREGKKDGLTAHLLTAKYQDETLITWILFVFKDTLYYPYGASSDEHRNVMASHLLMWEVIRFGKKLGLKKFDLWGKEEGKGFTRFKEGFAPKTVEFMGTWDLVFTPTVYKLYRIAEEARWRFLRLAAHLPLPKPRFR